MTKAAAGLIEKQLSQLTNYFVLTHVEWKESEARRSNVECHGAGTYEALEAM